MERSFFEQMRRDCYDEMLLDNTFKWKKVNCVQFAVEFGYNKANPKWVDAKLKKPIAYKIGHWDGKNSDQVLAEDKNGNRYLAHYCEGFMDGSKFEDWYDCRDFLIETEIVKYLEIPE
jgi:hypothetical protein